MIRLPVLVDLIVLYRVPSSLPFQYHHYGYLCPQNPFTGGYSLAYIIHSF